MYSYEHGACMVMHTYSFVPHAVCVRRWFALDPETHAHPCIDRSAHIRLACMHADLFVDLAACPSVVQYPCATRPLVASPNHWWCELCDRSSIVHIYVARSIISVSSGLICIRLIKAFFN